MINKELLKLLGNDKNKIVFITLLKILSMLCYIGSLAVFCYSLKNTIESNDFIFLWYLSIIPGLFLCKIIFDKINIKIQAKLANKIETKLRNELFDCIISNPKNNKKYDSQALAQLSIEGIEQLNMYYTSYLPQFFFSMISPLILFIFMIMISIPTSIFFLICLPLIPMSIIAVSKFAKKICATYWDKYLSMGGDFLDNIRGMKELKIFLYDAIRQKEMDNNAEEFRKITMKVLVMQLWSTSIMDFVTYAGAGTGIVISFVQCLNGSISSPFYLLFIIFIAVEYFMPMRNLGSLFHISMNGATAGKKILDILDSKNSFSGTKVCDSIKKIEFVNCTLSYGDNSIINNFSYVISNKGYYAISGVSGNGKSTLIKSLNRCLEPTNGDVLINGVSIKDIEYSSLMERIAFISYDSHVFKRTIKENFLFVNKEISETSMIDCLKMVRLDDFSLDFKFEEDALNVSGGQKQRFILAFYLSLNKDVFVFDEVTSNIDNESEKIIIDIIKNMRKSKIIIIVSHRLSNIIDSDDIIFIESSQSIIHDNHKKLLKNAQYNRLYNEQKQMEKGGC